jgi:hypothetical protein
MQTADAAVQKNVTKCHSSCVELGCHCIDTVTNFSFLECSMSRNAAAAASRSILLSKTSVNISTVRLARGDTAEMRHDLPQPGFWYLARRAILKQLSFARRETVLPSGWHSGGKCGNVVSCDSDTQIRVRWPARDSLGLRHFEY